ncbi:MAG TPA: PEP-CTERM sorting domain-containing protein [Candidatus Sulfotelmatobacter sp.]
MARADSSITIFNLDGNAGTTTAGFSGPFSVSGSQLTYIGVFAQGAGSYMSFSTGSMIGGNLYGTYAGGGQIATFNGGGPNSFTLTGNWNGYNGTIFTGAFSGVVSWIDNGCTGPASNETCHYVLSGPISGTWANGTHVNGETTQILFSYTGKAMCTGCGNYNGGNIKDLGGTSSVTTPEPNSLGLMGAGLLGLGFVVKRKAKGQVGQ